MADLLATLGVAVVVFVSTNLDEILLLAVFFADPRMRARSVVVGQFLGIGALVAASAVAAWASLAVPEGYPALLGVVPLALGLRGAWALRRGDDDDDDDELQAAEARAERRTHSQALAVAAVTIANGGDNLGAYIPLFARAPRLVPFYALAFAALTALWCLAALRLVRHPAVGATLRRYGHVALPVVLIVLGVWILAGARVLLS
jgi:cadmium resistance protein CadD (predicted permease)